MMEKNYIFRPAKPEEAESVYRLWHSLVGTPYCAWDQDYPARIHADEDIAAGALYLLIQEASIAAVATIRHCAEHDGLAPWASRRPCDLMRIGVARTFQGRGVAGIIMKHLIAAAQRAGFDGMRILVSKENLPAIRVYERAGAIHRGEAFEYNIHWLCREIPFSEVEIQ